jgi:hypothetical protein
MLQPSQDAALRVEALVLADGTDLQELDCGMLLEASVAAPSLEDLAHAAAANAPDELPWTEPHCAGRRVECRLVRGRLGGLRQEAAHRSGGVQEAFQLRAQPGLAGLVVMQRVFALLGRQVEQAIQLSVETG